MDDHRTAQDVEVHQGGDVGTSGVENGRDRDSMLATDDAEADKENAGPPSSRHGSERIRNRRHKCRLR
eukprot:scaffold18718_cov45-Attheya_sp.AAC.5